MSTEADKAVVRRIVEEALNRGNLAIADELVAPNFVDYPAPSGMQFGPAGFKAAVIAFRTAFPDLRVTIEEQIAAVNWVALRRAMRGKQRADDFGIPATGNPVPTIGIHVLPISDRQLGGHWGVSDDRRMLRPLAVIPTPGPSGSQASGPRPGPRTNGDRPPAADEQNAGARRHPEAAFALTAPDGGFDGPAGASPADDGWHPAQGILVGALPDMESAGDGPIADATFVATRWTMRGTHQGELLGLPPTGAMLTIGGISIDRVAGGKVTEHWAAIDLLGVVRQLGAVPAP